VSTIDSSASRLRALQLIGGLFILAAAHVVYTFFVYRARVLTHSAMASSDVVLFLVPAVVIFFGFFLLLRVHGVRAVWSCLAAFPLTLVSFWLSLLLPFNIYGT